MATFADKTGRAWTLEITVGDLPRLAAVGLSVAEAGKDLTRIGRALMADPEAFGRGLWVLVERQADKAGVTVDDFLAAMDGRTAFAAVAAMEEAVADFSLPPATSRKVLELLPAAREKADREMERIVERVMTEEAARIGDWSGTFGNSPARPASPTPDRSVTGT